MPRVVIFSGKAAPGYAMAKLIIKLIHGVADVVNHDPAVGDRLKVVFLPDYNVSNAERIIPACDLSEQISTGGHRGVGHGQHEAGAERRADDRHARRRERRDEDEVGDDNIFIFGMTADEVARAPAGRLRPEERSTSRTPNSSGCST